MGEEEDAGKSVGSAARTYPGRGWPSAGRRDASQAYKQRPRPWAIRCQCDAGGQIRSGSGRRGGAGRESSGRSPQRRPFPCPRAAESRRLLAPGPAPPPRSCFDRFESLWLPVCCQQSVTSGPPLSNRGGVPRSCPAAKVGGRGLRFRALWADPARAEACVPQVSPQGPIQRREQSHRRSRVQDGTDSTFPRQR